MKTRVAIVAMRSASEGPWTLARGNESGVRIVHMVRGERVRVDMVIGDLSDSVHFDSPGTFPLPWKRFDRYRVSKLLEDGIDPAPTTVEIILNGSASNVSGQADDSERPDDQ